MRTLLLVAVLGFGTMYQQTAFAKPGVTRVEETKDVKVHINWMWEDDNPCFKLDCILYVIEAKFGVTFANGSFGVMGLPTFRGTTSTKGCVRNAKNECFNGNKKLAIAWLQAGESHNPEAQREIAENADEALTYIFTLK